MNGKSDYIDRNLTFFVMAKFLYETALNNSGIKSDDISEVYCEIAENRLKTWLDRVPNALVRTHYTGTWERRINTTFSADFTFDEWFCSCCGCVCEDADEKPTYNFCPYCGADMREQK